MGINMIGLNWIICLFQLPRSDSTLNMKEWFGFVNECICLVHWHLYMSSEMYLSTLYELCVILFF